MPDSFGTNDNKINGITREEFIAQVNNDLTFYDTIPFKLPTKAVEGLIKDALDFFYRKYPDALEEHYFIVFSQYLNSEEFQNSRKIPLPREVYSVYGVDKLDTNYDLSSGDFSIHRAIGYSTFSSTSSSHNMVDNTIQWLSQKSLFSLLNDVVLNNSISYSYNRLSRTLKILGEKPTTNLVLQTYVRLDEEFLFEDDYFRKYVRGLAKKNLSKILKFFSIPLPGNVQIDFDSLSQEGSEEIEEVKQSIAEEEGMADYLFMSDSN